MKIYVGNLNYTTTEIELGALFGIHGKVERVNLIRDHFTRQSKCFGYVEMTDPQEGHRAMQALQGWRIKDRVLEISWTRDNQDPEHLEALKAAQGFLPILQERGFERLELKVGDEVVWSKQL